MLSSASACFYSQLQTDTELYWGLEEHYLSLRIIVNFPHSGPSHPGKVLINIPLTWTAYLCNVETFHAFQACDLLCRHLFILVVIGRKISLLGEFHKKLRHHLSAKCNILTRNDQLLFHNMHSICIISKKIPNSSNGNSQSLLFYTGEWQARCSTEGKALIYSWVVADYRSIFSFP